MTLEENKKTYLERANIDYDYFINIIYDIYTLMNIILHYELHLFFTMNCIPPTINKCLESIYHHESKYTVFFFSL